MQDVETAGLQKIEEHRMWRQGCFQVGEEALGSLLRRGNVIRNVTITHCLGDRRVIEPVLLPIAACAPSAPSEAEEPLQHGNGIDQETGFDRSNQAARRLRTAIDGKRGKQAGRRA